MDNKWKSDYVVSKYEEICPPQVEELCYITDNTYNKKEVGFYFHLQF